MDCKKFLAKKGKKLKNLKIPFPLPVPTSRFENFSGSEGGTKGTE